MTQVSRAELELDKSSSQESRASRKDDRRNRRPPPPKDRAVYSMSNVHPWNDRAKVLHKGSAEGRLACLSTDWRSCLRASSLSSEEKGVGNGKHKRHHRRRLREISLTAVNVSAGLRWRFSRAEAEMQNKIAIEPNLALRFLWLPL